MVWPLSLYPRGHEPLLLLLAPNSSSSGARSGRTVAGDVSGFLPSSVGKLVVCHDLDRRSLDHCPELLDEWEEDEVALPCHAPRIKRGTMVTRLHFDS